jgi:hypothetical protein
MHTPTPAPLLRTRAQLSIARSPLRQVGEILPTRTVPAIISVVVTAIAAGLGYALAVFYLSIVIPPQLVPINALCNAMVCFSIWAVALFVKAQVD